MNKSQRRRRKRSDESSVISRKNIEINLNETHFNLYTKDIFRFLDQWLLPVIRRLPI